MTTSNNSFKPNALRYTNNMADKACHVVGSATHVGLTQALGRMNSTPRLPKFWKLAVTEVSLAIGSVAIWFYFRTREILAVPPPPVGDLYAYNWGFQIIVFVVVWLPVTLLVVGILLAIQRQALKPYYSAQQVQDSGNAA